MSRSLTSEECGSGIRGPSVQRCSRCCSRTAPVFSQNSSRGAARRTARILVFIIFFLQLRQPIESGDAGMPGCGPAPLLIRAECCAASLHPGSRGSALVLLWSQPIFG